MYNPREFMIKKGILVKYVGKATEVVIPECVTAIGKDAFSRCEQLKSITIPNSVTAIGAYAFYQCRSLQSLTIPPSVTSIEEYAFYQCWKLPSIQIPQGIKVLNRSVFEECTNLTTVTLPESVTSIGYGAFCNCHKLRNISIPDSVVSIGQFAFSMCSSLLELPLPDSVTSIDQYAFCGCSKLEHFKVPGKVRVISESVFAQCHSLKYISIPTGVISIGPSAFSMCSSLTDITIPDTVTAIGKAAFEHCSCLTQITIPSCVRSLGEAAFLYCTGLLAVTVPQSVVSIGKFAFADCTALERITFGEGVYNINATLRDILKGSHNLKVILTPEVLPQQLESDHRTAAAMGYLSCPQRYLAPTVEVAYQEFIRANKTRIAAAIFDSDLSECLPHLMQTVKIPKSKFDKILLQPALDRNATQCIAFLMDWKNRHFSPLDLEDQLFRELMSDPFGVEEMRKLWSYQKLPDGSVCITGYKGDEAEVVIPERIGSAPVTAIGDEAFSTAKKGRTQARKDLLKLVETVLIPEGVISIGTCAFYGCSSLTLVTVPPSVTYISPTAFMMCAAALRGQADSYAQQYAKEQSRRYWIL